MQTVILTIVFLASPAGSQQTNSTEVLDMPTCESVAETWRRWPGGLLKVMSATCTPRLDTAAPAASSPPPGAKLARG